MSRRTKPKQADKTNNRKITHFFTSIAKQEESDEEIDVVNLSSSTESLVLHSKSTSNSKIVEKPIGTAHLISNEERDILECLSQLDQSSSFDGSFNSSIDISKIPSSAFSTPGIKNTLCRMQDFVKSDQFRSRVENDTISIELGFPGHRQLCTKSNVVVINCRSQLTLLKVVKPAWTSFELTYLTHFYSTLHLEFKNELMKEYREKSYLLIKFVEVAATLSFVTQCGNDADLFLSRKPIQENSMYAFSQVLGETIDEGGEGVSQKERYERALNVPIDEQERVVYCCQVTKEFLQTIQLIKFRKWKPEEISELIFALCRIYLDAMASVQLQVSIRQTIDKILTSLKRHAIVAVRQKIVEWFPEISEHFCAYQQILSLFSDLNKEQQSLSVICLLSLLKKMSPSLKELNSNMTKDRELECSLSFYFREIFNRLPFLYENFHKQSTSLGAIINSLNEVLKPNILDEFTKDDIIFMENKLYESSRFFKLKERINDVILLSWHDKIKRRILTAKAFKK
uniref:Uncharacterized protein n=1 Tax=Acrobeloides nanus TaxID=290746 RepID=A0A914C063_9BILA